MSSRYVCLAGMLCLFSLAGISQSSVSATELSFSSLDLDLDDPSTGNNAFQTIFRAIDNVSGTVIDGGPVSVDYVDENSTGMQVNLDVDFADPLAPIVNSIEFVGEPGDISHVFTGGAIDLFFTDGIFVVDFEAVPNGVKGFLRTQGGVIPVNPDGSFVSGNTNLVARQGSVDIDGTVSSLLGVFTVDETFNLSDTPLDQFNDSISAGSLNNVTVDFVGEDLGERVYHVTVSTLLENTELSFAGEDFELIFDISGTLLGRREIRVPIVPEPATVGLLMLALGTLSLRKPRFGQAATSA